MHPVSPGHLWRPKLEKEGKLRTNDLSGNDPHVWTATVVIMEELRPRM